MRRFNTLLAFAAILTPTTGLACSCGDVEDLSAAQRLVEMKQLAVVGFGSIQAIDYPAACKMPVLRWVNAKLGRQVPVVHKLRLRNVLWGRSAATIDVVQYQRVTWSSCEPLGDAACQPRLPRAEAFWPLYRLSNGEYHYAGRCGIALAAYFLGIDPETGRKKPR